MSTSFAQKEWGTFNIYDMFNPYICERDDSSKDPTEVQLKIERWEIEQIIKGLKPAFISAYDRHHHSVLSERQMHRYIKKYNLEIREYINTFNGSVTKQWIVGKDREAVDKVINAHRTGDCRALGLALGYIDLRK